MKLIYFPVRAKAEPIRMCMAYAGLKWDEVSYKEYYGVESWPEAKPKAPFAQLPLMEVEGVLLAQTGAIIRYVAKKCELMPNDMLAAAKVDMIYEASEELNAINPIVNVFKAETFAEKKKAYFENIKGKPERIQKQLGKGPFFMGEKPTFADFAMWHVLDNIRSVEPTYLDATPELTTFMKAVADLKGVKEYLGSRPDVVDIGTAPMLKPKSG